MKYITGADFYKYKAAHILKVARYGFKAAPVTAILQLPTGHKWVDSGDGDLNLAVLICQECSQEITLYRKKLGEMEWCLCDGVRGDVLPCSIVVMRKALL